MGMAMMAKNKTLFATFVGHSEQFEAHLGEFFIQFQVIRHAYELIRCLGVEIW